MSEKLLCGHHHERTKKDSQRLNEMANAYKCEKCACVWALEYAKGEKNKTFFG